MNQKPFQERKQRKNRPSQEQHDNIDCNENKETFLEQTTKFWPRSKQKQHNFNPLMSNIKILAVMRIRNPFTSKL